MKDFFTEPRFTTFYVMVISVLSHIISLVLQDNNGLKGIAISFLIAVCASLFWYAVEFIANIIYDR